jgi:putative transposase
MSRHHRQEYDPPSKFIGRVTSVSRRASLDWAWSGIRLMTFYRRNLPHLQRDAKRHFVTFVTRNRRTLPEWARDIVLDSIRHDDRFRYELDAAVVMPDHAHLILTPGIDKLRHRVIPLFEIMQAIKGASARKINQRLECHGAIWQEESFDHVLRSAEDNYAKVMYVLENPIRRGLVSDWREYKWLWHRPFPNPYEPPRANVAPDAFVRAAERSEAFRVSSTRDEKQ